MTWLKILSAELLQKLIILDQHFQPSSPSDSSPASSVKKTNSSANETETPQKLIILDKSKGGSSVMKTTSGASQAELLQNVVVLDRLKDGSSVKINSSIASQGKR